MLYGSDKIPLQFCRNDAYIFSGMGRAVLHHQLKIFVKSQIELDICSPFPKQYFMLCSVQCRRINASMLHLMRASLKITFSEKVTKKLYALNKKIFISKKTSI